MRIKIICGFKQKSKEFKLIEENYLKQMKNELQIDIIESPYTEKRSPDEIKKLHAQQLIEKTTQDAYKILLAEDGKQCSSKDLAELIRDKRVSGQASIEFVIGGPYGISKENYSTFNQVLSISEMTFTAEFCRIALVEQIFRSLCIIQGKPYHKD